MLRQLAPGGSLALSSREPAEQFSEAVRHLGIAFDPEAFMSRCARCNGKGFDEVGAAEVARRGDAAPKVLLEVSEFWECRRCKKVYWEGPQFLEAHERFGDAFDLRDDEAWNARIKTDRAQQLLAEHELQQAAAPRGGTAAGGSPLRAARLAD